MKNEGYGISASFSLWAPHLPIVCPRHSAAMLLLIVETPRTDSHVVLHAIEELVTVLKEEVL